MRAVMVVMLCWLAAPVQAAAQPFAYVASGASATLYVIDAASLQHVATVSLPEGTHVNALAVSRDGARVYASSVDAASVLVVNAQTNSLANTITVGPNPAALALTADGETVYVATGDATISRADATSTAAGRGVQVTAAPESLALTADGATLYVGHRSRSTATVITTSSMTPTGTVTLGGTPMGIALNAAGTRLFAVDTNGALSIVDLATGSIINSRFIGSTTLSSMALSPNDERLLITDNVAGTVTIIDAGTGQILATLTVVGTPQSVAIHPSSTYAYVVGRGGAAMTIVDLTSNTVSATVALPERGERVAFAPATPTAAVPQTGWWWNPSESGRGFSFETNASRMFFAFYMYAGDGTATWYLGTAGTGSGYVADLEQYAGGQTLSGAYQAASPRGSSGQVRAVYFSTTNGALVWPGGTTPIERFDFVSGGVASGAASGMPETGWWWNPAEPGRGFFIEAQSSSLFLAGFLYDDRGEPVWYTSQNAMTGTELYQGTLNEYADGQTLTGSYRAPSAATSRGTISIRFSSRTAGIMTLPNGSEVPIERFSF